MSRLNGDKNYSLREERLQAEKEAAKKKAEYERAKRLVSEARNRELKDRLRAKA